MYRKAIVTSKGQVTIPKAIRDQVRIGVGTELNFEVTDDYLIVRPVTRSLTSLKGIVKHKRKKPVSDEEMKRAIRNRKR